MWGRIRIIGPDSSCSTYNQSQIILRLAICLRKNPNNMLDLLKDTQNSTFLIVQCFAKSRNAMLGSGGREFPRKLAADIK